MPLQNILITASINSLVSRSYGQRIYIASTDEQSFPIETITGSQAGSWPDFISGTNYTTNLIVNITQSWSGSNVGPAGVIPFNHTTNEEFFNGEFSGSNYTVSDGNLTDEDCQEILTPSLITIPYDTIYSFSSSYQNTAFIGDQLADFYVNNPLGDGEIAVYLYEDEQTDVPPSFYIKYIEKIKIAKKDVNGVDQTLSLQELKKLIWIDSNIGTITLDILNIGERPTYFLYDVKTTIKRSNGTIVYAWIDFILDSNISFIFEPYLTSFFRNSDCDVLQNNATQPPTSQYHQRVLYDTGYLIPSNLDQIISGSAELAELNDYLYNASDNILPRYLGTRTTSPNINTPSVNGFTSTELSTLNTSSITSSNNSLANVEQYCDWFAYFNYIEPSDFYEALPGGAGTLIFRGGYYINLISLINIDGGEIELNSVNSEKASSNIPILQTVFPQDSKASLIIYNGLPFTSSLSLGNAFSLFDIYLSGYYVDTTNYPTVFQYNVPVPIVSPNEQGLIISGSVGSNFITSEDYPVQGLVIPENFNINYKNNILEIAQSAGYFKNI